MHTFKDKKNREWTIELDLSKAMQIEDYDMGQAMGEEPDENGEYPPRYIPFTNPQDNFFEYYMSNTKVVFTIIWILCREQAKDFAINNMEDFAKIFDGQTFNNARMAFFEELPDFFTQKKMTLKASIQSYFEAIEKMDERQAKVIREKLGTKQIDEILNEAEKRIRSDVDKMIEKGLNSAVEESSSNPQS